MRLVLVLCAAAALAWFTYARLERAGARAWPAAVARAIVWASLGILLLDVTCAAPAGPVSRPLVLLDGSLSMSAAGGRWKEALDSARAWGNVQLFGDGPPGFDSLPGLGRSVLGPALRAAAASDRRVIVVSDGELDDINDLSAEALARVSVRGFPRSAGPDVAIGRLAGPDRVAAGDTVRLESEVRASGAVRDSVRLEVRHGRRVLARRSVRLGTDGAATVTFAFPTAGLSGQVPLTVALTMNDAEPRDNARLWLLTVSPTPGVVLLASPTDWDARFLYRALRDVAQLPVRGYERLEATRWRSMATLAPVSTEEVTQAARQADLLILKGAAGLAHGSRARGIWRWPSGEGGETVIAGEWYASVPAASPVAAAFVGAPVDSFPPLLQATPIEPAPNAWVGINVQLARRGTDRPVHIGQVNGTRRDVMTAADGFWRWSFRGGASDQAYRAFVAGTISWLLSGADSTVGRARPVRPVVANGRPVLFEWSGSGTPVPVAVTLHSDGATRIDTLRFDGSGHAELWAPPGQYRYTLAGGGAGLIGIDTWSEEWMSRPVVLQPRDAPTTANVGQTNSRRWLWLFGLAVAGLAVEWMVRRRMGLR
ncbi:MAG: hypothetical protein ABI587_09365 [Gemmatimonadales bacterium]